jgi:hypothetical protein
MISDGDLARRRRWCSIGVVSWGLLDSVGATHYSVAKSSDAMKTAPCVLALLVKPWNPHARRENKKSHQEKRIQFDPGEH